MDNKVKEIVKKKHADDHMLDISSLCIQTVYN